MNFGNAMLVFYSGGRLTDFLLNGHIAKHNKMLLIIKKELKYL
jgi:hypothetical protein